MEIRQPLCITSRLLPGAEIGGATISIEYAHRLSDYQQRFRWYIDGANETGLEFQSDELIAGAGTGSLQEGLESLLGFLGAFADAVGFEGEEEENADLFPAGLADWATANADEISSLECELQEHPGELIVE
jgi:hypothetical protein